MPYRVKEKDENGRLVWKGRWGAKVVIDGKPHKLGTFEKGQKKLAKQAEDAYRAKVKGQPIATKESVASFAARWLEDYPNGQRGKPRRESSKRHYAERVSLFASEHATVAMGEIDRPTARRWAQTHPARARAVCAMFQDAYNDGLIPANHFLRLGLPRKAVEVKPLTAEEFWTVAELCETSYPGDFGRMVRAMFVFAGWTGVRPGEMLNLQRSHLDNPKRGRLKVEKQRYRDGTEGETKNGLERVVAFREEAREALTGIPARMDGFLFSQKRGKRMNHASLWRAWDPVRIAFGRPDLTWYDATKDFIASQLSLMGASPQEIAHQLGHTDQGETALRHYVHTYEDEAIDAILDLKPKNVARISDARSAEKGGA